MALIAVWVTVGFVVGAARWTKPTPESMRRFLHRNETRNNRGFIEDLAGKMNRLTFEERQQMKVSPDYLGVYATLTPSERERYFAATLTTDLRQTLEALGKMPRERRREFLDQVAGQAESNNLNLNEDPPAKERVRLMAEETLNHCFEAMSDDEKDELNPEVDRLWKYLHIW